MSSGPEIVARAAAEAVGKVQRRRVPAAERREELIEAAVAEFARGGLYGTPVGQIARRVGVAQPYVFSLFPTKRDLFLAAVERGFDRVANTFRSAAAAYARGEAPEDCEGPLEALGRAYIEMLSVDRDSLMLQHHSYAACDDKEVRRRVRRRYAQLVDLARELTGAGSEELDEFFQQGMALNVAAALGVEDLSSGCDWVRDELRD
ncbi:MAG TPA: TetR/AcrR family transcriptional regulator [Solirubrobacteraceae bacterium]|nr:TetR/AcrR family transcriptional regulator [Solirubrobacteraceae bacterium]